MGGIQGGAVTFTEDLVEFVKRWEGLKLEASPDPLVPGVWDVGYGHKLAGDERPTITREQADEMLRSDLAAVAAGVDEAVTVPLAQNEFDALVSLAYNIGNGALARSTLMRRLNDSDFYSACDEFLRWNRAGGRIVPGLVKRRYAEQAIFGEGDYSGAP
jgi:lysozyme